MTPEARFAAVLERHGPALRRLVAAWERDAAAREDLLQDVLLALWRALPRFRGDCAERTFVLRVANNRVLSHRFRRRPAGEELDGAGEVHDPAPTPERAATAAERLRRLVRALETLPDGTRQVLTLALEGLTRGEIAAVLGVTENNAAVRLSRARRALHDAMEKTP
ncbi:MAG TPA: sigma-70 family RNA polymerase sigma factor [Thermoanaerobaculia bacterium]|nr:sigma-70 family RNA polymerase sigma factor [Thermoanaerobaculia bacterium]